jgi:hypothetical protein
VVDRQVERRESFLPRDLSSPGLTAPFVDGIKGKMRENDFGRLLLHPFSVWSHIMHYETFLAWLNLYMTHDAVGGISSA